MLPLLILQVLAHMRPPQRGLSSHPSPCAPLSPHWFTPFEGHTTPSETARTLTFLLGRELWGQDCLSRPLVSMGLGLMPIVGVTGRQGQGPWKAWRPPACLPGCLRGAVQRPACSESETRNRAAALESCSRHRPRCHHRREAGAPG